MEERKLNSRHPHIRQVLRLLGPMTAGLGLLLIVIGMASFFSSFGSFGPPRYFWCAFVGMPLLGLGVAMTKFGYLGAITRYYAGEVAPVGKDTFNYLAEGTQTGVRTAARSLAEGLAAGGFGGSRATVACQNCSHPNDEDARFCGQCGTALQMWKSCPSCNRENDPAANFCDNCGYQF
jgi:hypothetical protein